MKRSDHHAGFTLMELLVVISIITLLISLIQPSLQNARRHARTVQCSTQVAQMAWAVVNYADENRGRMFPIVHAERQYWMGKLGPYWNEDHRLIVCPDASTPSNGLGDARRAWGPGGGWMDNLKGSYGMNLWLLPAGAFASDASMTQAGYIRQMDAAASNVPVFGDSQWVGAWPDDQDLWPSNFITPPNNHAKGYFMNRFCLDRHSMAINVSFIDGSARQVTIGDLWKLKWHQAFKPGEPVMP